MFAVDDRGGRFRRRGRARWFHANPLVVEAPFVRFCASAPFAPHFSLPGGTLSILDARPRQITAGEVGLLKHLAVIAANNLKLHSTAIRQMRATERQRAATDRLIAQNQEMKIKEALFSQVESMTRIGAWQIDLTMDRVIWSEAVFDIFGRPRGDPPGKDVMLSHFPPRAQGLWRRALGETLENGRTLNMELPLIRSTGEERWVRLIGKVKRIDGCILGAYGSIQDVTERRLQDEAMRQLAHHDVLTGLANRALFNERLAKAIARVGSRQESSVLCLLDLDKFKLVNDLLGHAAGDELLVEVGKRLTGAVGRMDTAARLGGDEFAVILNGIEDIDEARTRVQRVLDVFQTPLMVGSANLNCRCSIGATMFDGPSLCPSALLASTDAGLYESKAKGRGCITLRHFSASAIPAAAAARR